MNESKKNPKKASTAKTVVTETSALNPEIPHWKKLTDKDIAVAIGESIPATKKPIREKEIKVPQPRKFKTHSEKKKFKNQQVGKK
jgi:hypothetical protein